MPLPVIGLIGLIEKPRLEDADFYLQKMNMRYYVSNGIQESDITRLETD